MKKSLLILLSLLLTACQSSPTTDYDPKVNFGAMKTFALLSPPQTTDPLSSERIRTSVEQSLLAKGFSESATPDFKVTWAFETGSKPSGSGLSIGLGSGSWGRSGGVSLGTSVGIPLGGDKLYQLIQIDVLSSGADKLLWRGSDGFEFSEGGDDKADATQATVDKILALFPPK
ncbi:DUF4136 domain-containing protein [Shewanella sp. 3B26]|uniref:DUF4136 domain-containing protein n=1 Tax=Shewanella zhuhaiensis TaxID=2919576 RepID=A0AAJ1BHH9_9GAMM|nr:DUF4136 domain-containing protein [Shewanella zhuhaiensis]MCH4294810.1 DUF4136 domain-containing protein [Shewanella zhuhaiensis]